MSQSSPATKATGEEDHHHHNLEIVIPEIIALNDNHFTMDQSNPLAKQIAKSLPWFGPKYSPHDVPNFYDVSGITENPEMFKTVIKCFIDRYKKEEVKPTHVCGFDARGFLFGPSIAMGLDIPFVMIRKAGKLPGVLVSSGEYITEYSKDETVMRFGAIKKGDRVVLVDDLIATGGTAIAGFELVSQLGAIVHEFAAIIELPFLDGVKKIHEYKDGKFKDVPCFTMVDCLTIGDDQGRDPEDGVPRIVKADECNKYTVDEKTGKVVVI
jgi:adenine phosphoribosyltransferase